MIASLVSSTLVTLKLAGLSTLLLIFLCCIMAMAIKPLPKNLANIIRTFISIPLVLPPVVLGFYLLLVFSWVGQYDGLSLAFSFEGLVLGSILYSLPFVYQPIQNALDNISRSHTELAATMGASAFDRFFSVTLPLAKNGFISAAILGFAHTIGEFGVVLMIGGNIPGETQVLSVLLYEYVEMGDYNSAHNLAAILLLFSFSLLFAMYHFSGSVNAISPVKR
ncbi:MAG: molybdate ABC transporter permease subunit [Cellvibrionaceae bacterium]|nr:molybdate ABC transporter permease subunit [Cellvibrionaceae bacterium]